jgi:glycosyltransferase involved in cell wall biosynthesis
MSDRILVVSYDYGSRSGGAIIAEHVSRSLAAEFDVRVVRFCEGGPPTDPLAVRLATARSERRVIGGLPVTQLGPPPSLVPPLKTLARLGRRFYPARLALSELFFLALRPALRPMIAEADLVHFYNGGLPLALWHFARMAAALGKPVAVTPFLHLQRRGAAVGLPAGLGGLLLPAVCRHAAFVVAMTEFERRWLIAKGVAPTRSLVAPGAPELSPSPDPERFRRAHGLGEHPSVLFVGRLTQAKGVGRLLRAAPLVWQERPDVRFVFIGAPIAGELDHGVFRDPRLLFLGEQPNEGITDAIAACTLLCVPSQEESLGLVYLEAWALAKPVVGLRLPVLETLIDDGVDGLLVAPSDESIARAILALVSDPARATRLGLAGAAKVRRDFRWTESAARVGAACRRALAERRQATSPPASAAPLLQP